MSSFQAFGGASGGLAGNVGWQTPYLFLPNGWSTEWLAAKAAAATTPAWITVLGDSMSNGYTYVTSIANRWPEKVVASLLTATGLPKWGDYYSALGDCAQAGMGLAPADAPWGSTLVGNSGPWNTYGYDRSWANIGGSTAVAHQLFTSPAACTAMDLIYLDLYVGTWQFMVDTGGSGSFTYNIDGGGPQAGTANTWITVTNKAVVTGQGGGSHLRKVVITGLSSAAHTIQYGKQSAAGCAWIMGVATYTGQNGLGLGRISSPTQAAFYFSSNGGAVAPLTRGELFGGHTPLGTLPFITTPASQMAGSQGGAGNVPNGSHWYGYTFVGAGGESAVGGISATVTVASGPAQVSLTGIAASSGSSVIQRNVYRSDTSNTGPWGLVGSLANNSGTTLTDNLAVPGAAPPNTTTPTPSWSPGFGFPMAPHLLIIEQGINDTALGAGTFTTYVGYLQDGMRRTIEAVRRARANCSVLIVVMMNPNGITTDAASAGFPYPQNYQYYVQGMEEVAAAFNCALVNIHAKWPQTPFAAGFVGAVTDLHTTNAGHADIAQTISGIV